MRLVTSAVMATLALTLSACGGDDPPPPEPTTTATTPANPDATLPPMPEVAKEFTPSGVSTFTRHFVDVMGYAAATGDLQELQRLSDPQCEGCARYVEFFKDTYESGGFIRQTWSAPSGSEVRFDKRRQPEAESFVTTDLKISAGEFRESKQASTEATSESSDTVTFGLRFDDGWTVTQFWEGKYE
ncbi:DUF6318 family protein [Aeromicrobium sp. HA]|uniref:DUF6318 family protein n=1 Tax=Aeromicrobium sp. HA TaxID=3009077 RepID=UPI0022B03F5A|nr:DUF6318 family protein [Aeromicrobium sp. HA]